MNDMKNYKVTMQRNGAYLTETYYAYSVKDARRQAKNDVSGVKIVSVTVEGAEEIVE